MYKLCNGLQLLVTREPFLDKILDRLDVVVGGSLNILDAACVHLAETIQDMFKLAVGCDRQGRHFDNILMGSQALQPAYLHQNPALDQPEFTENLAQLRCFAPVASVDRRDSGEC